MKNATFLATALLVASVLAADQSAVDILLKISPTANTCNGALFPAECATAAQAADGIIASFSQFQINTPGEQAALIALMALESGDYKYVRNHFPAPGRPGQGTRNMMMPDFVSEYAAAVGVAANNDKAGQLDNVIRAGHEWGSAAWYYSTKCSEAVKSALKAEVKGDPAAYTNYITTCVGTTMDDARTKYWTLAAAALGID